MGDGLEFYKNGTLGRACYRCENLETEEEYSIHRYILKPYLDTFKSEK